MNRFLFFLSLLIIHLSCSAPKNFTWRGKMVTEKKYDRVVKRYTKRFIKSRSVEENLLMLGVDVRFDTLQNRIDTVKKH